MSRRKYPYGRKVNLGTISHATMRNKDLIPAFVEELERIDTKREFNDLVKKGKRIIKSEDWDSENTSYFLNETIFNALNYFAPSQCYFGSHVGDGSDYGFWTNEYLGEDFDGLKVNDLNKIPKDYAGEIMFINDHGNVTLYKKFRTSKKLHEIWSIV